MLSMTPPPRRTSIALRCSAPPSISPAASACSGQVTTPCWGWEDFWNGRDGWLPSAPMNGLRSWATMRAASTGWTILWRTTKAWGCRNDRGTEGTHRGQAGGRGTDRRRWRHLPRQYLTGDTGGHRRERATVHAPLRA